MRVRQHLWGKHLIPIVLFIIGCIGIYAVSHYIPAESIRQTIKEAGVFGPIVWGAMTIITFVVAPLSGTPMLFIGYFAFGKIVIIYSLITGIIGSAINFYIAKRWGRGLLLRLVGHESLAKIDKLTENYGLTTLFLLRVFQSGLHDFISYAAGLTSMRFYPYMIITILGFAPGALLWYLLSLYTKDPFTFTAASLVLSYILSGVFIGATYFAKKRSR